MLPSDDDLAPEQATDEMPTAIAIPEPDPAEVTTDQHEVYTYCITNICHSLFTMLPGENNKDARIYTIRYVLEYLQQGETYG